MVKKNTFPKKEHLCGEIRVSKLFSEGNAFIVYPLRVVYKFKPSETKTETEVKVLVSVPKKRFKHAVNRNRIKRLIRESYRLHKFPVIQEASTKSVTVHLAFNYIADSELSFSVMETKMNKIIAIISDKIKSNS